MAAVFVYVAISLPMLTLSLDQLGDLYGRLIGRSTVDQLVERMRSRGLSTSWASLARIAIWFVVGLVLIDLVLPDKTPNLARRLVQPPGAKPFGYRSITAPRGDPRGFTPTPNDDVFKIAWIGGSELRETRGDVLSFLPMSVRSRMPVVDGRPVSIDMYFVSGMRLFDEYAAVLAAIDDDVDAIVVSVNPVWSMNDLAIQGWDNLDPHLAVDAASRPSAWRLAASFLDPSDVLWGFSSALTAIDDRYQWETAPGLGRSMETAPEPAAPTTPSGDAVPSVLDRIRQMTSPLEFWSEFGSSIDADLGIGTGGRRVRELCNVEVGGERDHPRPDGRGAGEQRDPDARVYRPAQLHVVGGSPRCGADRVDRASVIGSLPIVQLAQRSIRP